MKERPLTLVDIDALEKRMRVIIKEELELSNSSGKQSTEELLTRAEAAKLLRVSLPTLKKYADEGIIPPPRKLNDGRVLYLRSEIISNLKISK